MKLTRMALSAALFFVCLTSYAEDVKRPHETVTPNFMHEISNIPGTSMITAVVTYPPNGASPYRCLLAVSTSG